MRNLHTGLRVAAADSRCDAAGPQGREGLTRILGIIDADLGPIFVEQHHLIDDGDLVEQLAR